MIIGIGQDLCDIRRIEKTLVRFGTKFEKRCFTEHEIKKAQSREKAGLKAATYAKRYAAKEATAKALKTGLSQGVGWKDIEVINLTSGEPTLKLDKGALKHLERLIPSDKKPRIHLSLTDEYPYAQAFVIIEAI